jgi:U3 small nucleolar RNA-associated protein MPP10
MEDIEMGSDAAPLAQLVDILEHPEQRILPLLYKSTNPKDRLAKQKTQSELIQVVQHLFQGIEETAKKYQELSQAKPEEAEHKEEESSNLPPLSGLSELYVPETDDQDAPMDVETLWGQIELQNDALHKLLKKSINRLAKAPEDIIVLDMGQLSSDEGEDGSRSDDDSSSEPSEAEAMNEDEDEDDSGDEDEEAKRIRERMERAMDDAESEDDDGSEEDHEEAAPRAQPSEEKEELYDPVVEDMKDGFFDLNEMEEYADEEEDYLPQEDYGKADSDKKKKNETNKKSFHQMQRDGDLLDRSDDDEDEEGLEDLYEEDNEPVKRKKYREDEDIEALYSLYQTANDSDSEAEDAANMTASDVFGKPSKKYIERYSSKKAKEEVKGDDDSWGEYDFEDGNPEENHKHGKKHAEKESDSENDDDDDDNSGEEEEEESENKDTKKKHVDNSRHGKQQDRLRKQTEQLENELLAEKPWQMTGETKSTSRPVNSLLEGTPEFEMASKQAPTITIEHTTNLEDAIKKRIVAEDWDDVIPRELPDVGWHKKRGELPEVSQEKSKLGLGELYEREYLKKAIGYDKDAEEKKSEEDKAKDEMKQLFANLCSKLDGLSNYQFAPRPIADEAEVRTASVPAIAMEEVLPLHVNDARGVAPEEVFASKRGRDGVLRGETEMDQQERKRLRQSKKAARRKTRKEKLADEKFISRLEPGLGLNNPYEKRKMREELQMARAKGKIETGGQDMDDKYGSSGTFFKRLQAEAQQVIKGQPSGEEEQKKKSKPKSSALTL